MTAPSMSPEEYEQSFEVMVGEIVFFYLDRECTLMCL